MHCEANEHSMHDLSQLKFIIFGCSFDLSAQFSFDRSIAVLPLPRSKCEPFFTIRRRWNAKTGLAIVILAQKTRQHARQSLAHSHTDKATHTHINLTIFRRYLTKEKNTHTFFAA